MSDTTTIYQALLAAQQAMGPVRKNASNPAFKSKYATLDSVLDAITGPLNDHGFIVVQRLDYDPESLAPILRTEVIYAATGEKLASAMPIVCKDPANPQAVGGAITYLRRYSLLALLNVAPEDDDGHAASQPVNRASVPHWPQDAAQRPPEAPRDAQPPARASVPLTYPELNTVFNKAGLMVAEGKTAEEVYQHLMAQRPRASTEQVKEIAATWRALKEQIAERDAAIDQRATAQV